MGLPLWRDSDEDTTLEDTAAKLDRAAAARRSTIRREPSIRPARDHVPPQSIHVFLRSRHQSMMRNRDRLQQEEREANSTAELLILQLEQLQRTRLRTLQRMTEDLQSPHAARDSAESQIQPLQRELERWLRTDSRNRQRMTEELSAAYASRDSTDLSSPSEQLSPNENAGSNTEGPSDTSRQPLPRPPRESNLRFELLPSSSSRSSSPWRYQMLSRTSMPSPPRSADSDRRDLSIPDGPIPGESWSLDNPRMPALTEGFAPARAVSSGAARHNESSRLDEDYRGLETPPPESWEGLYPPLHRVGHTSPRPLPRVDGLGDRRRSLSPSEQNEDESWISNLLTTMDTSQPSSASSFASSGSDSLRRANNSSQTTSTSFGEIGSLDDTCELDLPEGITEDDVRSIRERHYSSVRRPLPDRHLIHALGSIRQHMDHSGNTQYEMFDAIAERMLRRQSIPADWWVTIGLPSDFGRRTG